MQRHDRVSGAARGRYVVGLVVAVVVGVLAALLTVAGIVGSTKSAAYRARAGDTLGGDITLAVIAAVIAVVCVLLAVHFEHQLRRHRVEAQAWADRSGSAGVPAGPMPAGPVPAGRRRRSRHYSPVVAAIQVLVMTVIVAGFVALTFVEYSAGQQSSRIQHHGIHATGTIASYKNTYHQTKSSGYYTATIVVTLDPPVSGRAETTVHFPGRNDTPVGSSVDVLMDPHGPGYAEFPGDPSTKSWEWVTILVVALVFALLDGLLIRSFVRHLRHRRSMAAMSAGPGASGTHHAHAPPTETTGR